MVPNTSLDKGQLGPGSGSCPRWGVRFVLDSVLITGESATADEGAAKIFPEELAKIIEDGDYSADQVFNADETGLYWKKLPNPTYIAKDEKTATGHKANELPVDDALSDNDIIDLTLDLTVDGVVGLEGRATQNENEVCENPWPLPKISIAETVSSDHEGDLKPLRKRCKPLSDSDND
ncbi:putative Tigger transposable element-derived protein 2 [Trichonephila clavipes]|nr:putative Tigger transposable element-derived protein 2 [Trichonephila clavipes]